MIRSLEQSHFADKTTGLPRRARFAIYGEILFLTALVALCAAYLMIVQQNPVRYTLDGARDRLDGSGWYGMEQHGALTYRWSTGSADVRLPLRHKSGRTYLITLTAQSLHPDGPQPVRFLLNDQLIAAATPDREARTYRFLLAPAQGDAGMRFGFATRPFRPADDNRDLGLLVSHLVVQSIPAPDWILMSGAPVGLLVLWGSMRRRATRWPALTIVVIHALALMTTATLYRPTALPFTWFAFPTLAAAALSVFVAQAAQARIGLAALAALVGYSGVIWPLAFTDDAFISFQYARNLVAGHGLVFNPGERVEGYTNFLWTMLAALTIWLGGDPVFWGYAAGIAIGLAIVLVSYRVAAAAVGPGWGLAAALLVASSQSLLVYTARGTGMETGFFTLLVLLGSGMYLSAYPTRHRQRYLFTGVIFALAALTRPEGAMVFGLTVGHALLVAIGDESDAGGSLIKTTRTAVRSTLPLIASFLGVFVPYFAWRWWYYGDLLPNTFYAKTGGGVQQWLRGAGYAADFALVFGGPLLLFAAAAPLATFADRSSRKQWRAALTAPVGYLWLLCAVYTVYIIFVGGDHFPGERFFAPIIPLLAILIATGLSALTLSAIARRAPRLAYATATIAVAMAAWLGLNRGDALERRVVGNDESVWIWADLGTWLQRNTPPDASVAAAGIGAIAYYSQRETIDMHGLTDRHIARVAVENMGSGAAGHEKRDPEYVLHVRKPTYIPRLWEDYFGGAAVLQQQYELITIRTDRGFDLQLWRRLPTAP
jgi:hypothetical protein